MRDLRWLTTLPNKRVGGAGRQRGRQRHGPEHRERVGNAPLGLAYLITANIDLDLLNTLSMVPPVQAIVEQHIGSSVLVQLGLAIPVPRRTIIAEHDMSTRIGLDLSRRLKAGFCGGHGAPSSALQKLRCFTM